MTTYISLLKSLFINDYVRVEKDDRLLDIFSTETREKGVELWEKWDDKSIYLLRVKLPFNTKTLKLYRLPRAKTAKQLLTNQSAKLSNFQEIAKGDAIVLHF
ncbi:MAG: hypothetical protein Q8P73_00975 [bacterium]|nr:hypothetical protein [bacterium]